MPIGTAHKYNEYWAELLEMLDLTHCNAIDVGANNGKMRIIIKIIFKTLNLGDTSLNLAEALHAGGKVVGFEMGPPIKLFKFNKM